MDLKSLLPFLLSNNNQSDKIAPILNMFGNDTKNDENAKGNLQSELIDKLTGNGNPHTAEILKSAMSSMPKKNNIAGITPILGVVDDDILGKMVKYLNRH